MQETSQTGQLSKSELISEIQSGKIKYVTVCFPTVHNTFTKRWEAKYFLKHILENGYKLPEISFNINYNHGFLQTKNINIGSTNDVNVEIDTNCIRRMPWLGPKHVICLTNCMNLENKPNTNSPRNILKKVLEKAEKKSGYFFQGASELEYYVFKTKNEEILKSHPGINLENHKLTNKKSDYCLANQMDKYESFNEEVKDNITNTGIELEGMFTEYGPGQHEVNIRYKDILTNCDNHILLKRCIKHTMYKKDLGCTFMAKPLSGVDGSSCHIHLSILDKEKKNIFLPSPNKALNHTLTTLKHGKIEISKKMLYFIGGLTKYSKELFLCYAPTVNSYKRFKQYTFAPFYINTWCYDSKTGGIRVLGEKENLRLEIRLAGADANPYVLLSAIIASGMKGIEDQVIPRDMDVGDVYGSKADGLSRAPKSILQAAEAFEESEFAKDVFGEGFRQFMGMQGKLQWEEFDHFVSSFEVERYLDLA